jgi:hypothetical protein
VRPLERKLAIALVAVAAIIGTAFNASASLDSLTRRSDLVKRLSSAEASYDPAVLDSARARRASLKALDEKGTTAESPQADAMALGNAVKADIQARGLSVIRYGPAQGAGAAAFDCTLRGPARGVVDFLAAYAERDGPMILSCRLRPLQENGLVELTARIGYAR